MRNSLINHSFPLMKPFLSSSLFLILLTCFVKESHGLEDSRKEGENFPNHYYHTLDITSLFPASVCTHPSYTGFNKRQSTLKVTHQHGPCFGPDHHNAATTPSLSEILSHDQARVNSLQARIDPKSKYANKIKKSHSHLNRLNDKKTSLPAQSGRPFGTGNYIVTVGLGTPTKTLSVVFDTGSDLTWTQCRPCARSCYQQKDPIFDPSASTSFLNVSCNSAECTLLSSATGINPGCSMSTCIYGIKYGDQSFSIGYFSRDKLTLTETDTVPKFIFGCGQNNQGLFGNTAGILGLGRNPLSIISQTAQSYGKYFSYCIPSTSSSTGFFSLGKSGNTTNVQFTPFSTSRSKTFYFIDITSIMVGGTQLPISQTVFSTTGSIIDSGTVITRLPPAAYAALRSEFRKRMAQYTSAPAISILDTCYDFTGFTTITIPTVSFTFSGNVKVDLDPTGILVGIGMSRLCLAFSGNNLASSIGILGNTQQKTFEVVYDVAGGKLGFGPGGCQ